MTDHSEGHPSLVSFAPESALNEVEDRLASESRIKAAVMAGEGEMPRFMRAMDWTKSPLGLVSNWPQSLRTALSICLNSRFPIAIWWGPELVLLYNDSWRLIFADEHPWMVGRPGHEYCPETWDVIGSMLKDLLETGRGVYSDDKTLSVKEHGKIHERYYSWSHSPIRSDDGGVGGVFTTVTETTSHVMATRELKTLPDFGSYRQESQLQESIFETWKMAAEAVELVSDGVYIYDSDWRLNYLNPAAEAQSRAPRQFFIGRTVWESFPEVLGSDLEVQFRKAMESRQPADYQYYHEPWERWFSHRLYPAPDGGLTVYVRDITETKLAEQALKRADQLAVAGRLAASIAHEINNPLEAVTNLLFLASNEPSISPAARQMLEIADQELRRLNHIASTGLKFYRQVSAPACVSAEELLESVLFVSEARFKMLRIELRKRFVPSPPIECYPAEVQQVFTNLIGNAIDAIGENGQIEIRIRPVSSFRGHSEAVRITFADNGHGMTGATRRRLFEAFFTTKKETGTGLGLWVSKGIVEKHGGRIHVRSRSGVGTVFSLVLPCKFSQAIHHPGDAGQMTPTSRSASSGSPGKTAAET